MSRIRTIKPDFWTDGRIIALSPYARLLYIGSWNFTLCDRGHLADDANGLRLKVLPGDTVDGDVLLAELLAEGRIVRLELPDGRTFLHIPRFEDHQKIDTRWNSRCPVCTHQDSLKLTETHASLGETRGISASSGETRLGGEGKGKESKGGEEPPRKCPEHSHLTIAPNCGACKELRLAREAWEKTRPTASTPSPPRDLPNQETCSHKFLAGWCVHCALKDPTIDAKAVA
jgi:hypothetical protein